MLCLTNIGFVQCFSFGSRKVMISYTLLLRFSHKLFCVLCLTNTGFVQCYSLGSRQVCCMLVFILLYSVIFCFACFASSTSGLCSAFLFGSPQVYTLLVFFVLFSLLLLCLLCSTSSGLCSDFSPAPLEFACFIFWFILFSFKFVFCVLSLTNLINLPSIPVKLVDHFCCICALFGQSVRRVLFYTVYRGVISSASVDFE